MPKVGIITRSEIRQMLTEWQSGKMSHAEVHELAGSRISEVLGKECQFEDEVVKEILFHLDMMDIDVISPDDIPVLLSCLDIGTDQITQSLDRLQKHFSHRYK